VSVKYMVVKAHSDEEAVATAIEFGVGADMCMARRPIIKWQKTIGARLFKTIGENQWEKRASHGSMSGRMSGSLC
jgi:hypothetical protein